MDIEGHLSIRQDPAVVIAALNDPAMLQAVIPSCTEARQIGPGRFRAKLTRRVGPLALTIEPDITVAPVTDGRSRMTISAGSLFLGQAVAELDLKLAETPAGTRLVWQGEVRARGMAHRLLSDRQAKLSDGMRSLFVALKRRIEAA